MLFVKFVENDIPQLVELTDRYPHYESIVGEYGYPVELYITEESSIYEIICEPHEIGWFDEGEDSDELVEFSIKEANFILYKHAGLLEIQIHEEFFDEDESVIPVYVDQKVIIKYIDDEESI